MSQQESIGQVHFERVDHILKITIDNVAKRNAFVPQMMTQLSEALTLLERDDELWVGVICAAGDHFTAGLDMPKFFGPDAKPEPRPQGNVDPFGLTANCSKPIVTAVQGLVLTVGIEMMLAGDIVVAAEDARFCQMEAKRGIAPLGGAHFRFLSRTGWGNAMYHLLLCDEFDAHEAYRIGLVQEVVPVGRQIERALEIAAKINQNAPLGVRATLFGARQYLAHGQQAAVEALPAIRDRVFGTADAAEGIRSFVERRPAAFQGR